MKNVTRPALNPLVSLFIKITVGLAAALVILVVGLFLLKILLIAAVLAAVAVGVFFIYNLIRRRRNYPAIR